MAKITALEVSKLNSPGRLCRAISMTSTTLHSGPTMSSALDDICKDFKRARRCERALPFG